MPFNLGVFEVCGVILPYKQTLGYNYYKPLNKNSYEYAISINKQVSSKSDRWDNV